MNFTYFDGEHPASRERFILPIKPIRSREFNPFHRKHHKASNASSERRSNKTASKVPLFSVEHPHAVKGDRLRGIGCSPPYINPNRYTRYVLTDFRDLITVKITHKYALRGIVPSPLYAPPNATRFVASFRTYIRCQDANYSSGVPFLESESPALSPDLNGTALHPEEGYDNIHQVTTTNNYL